MVSHYEAKLFALPCVSCIFKCTLTNSHGMSEETGETYINTATLEIVPVCSLIGGKRVCLEYIGNMAWPVNGCRKNEG